MEFNCYVDPNYKGPAMIRGYLKKLKCDRAMMKFLKRFNKRYFILDLSYYIFYYQSKENTQILQKFDLNQLVRVDSNPRISDICDWKFPFTVVIGDKTFNLYADSASAHAEWCNGFRACVKPFTRMAQGEIANCPRIAENVPVSADVHSNLKSEFKVEGQNNAVGREKNNGLETGKNQETGDKRSQEPDVKRSQELVGHKKQDDDARNSGKESVNNWNKNNEFNKFVVVAADKRDNSRNARHHEEDEDDIKVISQPKNIKKTDDLDRVVPVIFAKERPMSKRGVTPIINREEAKEVRTEERKSSYGRATSVYKERIVFNQNGINDMMNELDDLGLDKVEVRTGVEFRQKVSASRTLKTDNFKDSQNSTNTSDGQKINPKYFAPEPTEKSRSIHTKESRVLSSSDPNEIKFNHKELEKKPQEYFAPEPNPKKSSLSGLSYRPVSNKIPTKPKFVEKPEIVADEEVTKARNEKVVNNKPPSSKDRAHKEKAVYKEQNSNLNPQGNDCDWDNWDD